MKRDDKRLLAVFAHPDDESFCCGGSLAKAAAAGARIHLICVTRGEDGEWYGKESARGRLPGLPDSFQSAEKERKLAAAREKELKRATQLIGIEQVEYLNYVDGCLCNRDLPGIVHQLEKKIKQFKPQVVLTFDRGGISGHIDHIVASYATLAAVKGRHKVERLYCSTATYDFVAKIQAEKPHFPDPLVEAGTNLVKYDVSDTWEVKMRAVKAHETQRVDWQRLMPIWEQLPKFEYYRLAIERKPEELDEIPFF